MTAGQAGSARDWVTAAARLTTGLSPGVVLSGQVQIRSAVCCCCISAWLCCRRLCGRKGGGTQARDIGELLQLRQYLGHVMGNLQLYLQLDVIETNYEWLLGQVAAAQVGGVVKKQAMRVVWRGPHMLVMLQQQADV